MNIQSLLSARVGQALAAVGAPSDSQPHLRQSAKAQFGDYQANGIMAIAKQMNLPPRQLAEKVVAQLDLTDIAEQIDIAGPGFINIKIGRPWLEKQLEQLLDDPRLGIAVAKQQTIVVDYSAPNVAKEMHVGHLRSTLIGDAVVRTLEFLGHRVIRANHVGDWGTQFGMLIAYLEQQENQHTDELQLADLEAFYRQAKKNYDEDPVFAERARQYVVKLQSGDRDCRRLWRKLVDVTMEQNQLAYQRLNVTLTRADMMGESLYNSMLPAVVADLRAKGIAIEDQGAVVVFLDEFKNKDGDSMGVIIQKSDGGYLYTTTDIACAKYRYETLHADRILYYIDSRQHQHLMQAWTIVRKAGYVPPEIAIEHHPFGMMLGKDGKPFKTRAGGTIKLTDLLDEASTRAADLILRKNSQLDPQQHQQVVNAVAIGAIKYADLSKNRTTDYVFDWDNMLSFEGNTAPYIQYAYTRIISIFKRVDITQNPADQPILLNSEHEKSLALCLLRFEEILSTVAQEGTPHLTCGYLYELAGLFSSFYEHCPILQAENAALRASRLKLAGLTAKTLKIGLETLGIDTVEKM